jgi:hypothetical protein
LFERRPRRSYRFRRPFPAETAVFLAAGGRACATLPPGYRAYVAIHQIAPGTRTRLRMVLPRVAEADLCERDARLIFGAFADATPKVREVDATILLVRE